MGSEQNWCVYLLKCSDNSLYCGVTIDPENRLTSHNNGTASKYTRSRLPVTMVQLRCHLTKKQAYQLEYRIKKTAAAGKVSVLKNWTFTDP